MALTYTVSNHFKQQLNKGEVDFDTDVFKIILMNDTFSFDKDTHATYATVSGSELPTEGGYTQKNATLSGVSVTEDDTEDKSIVTWDNVIWTATASGIGPTGAYVVLDDTTSDDTVCWCVDFGTDYTLEEDSSLEIQNIKFSVA